jgi:hypothetical protein
MDYDVYNGYYTGQGLNKGKKEYSSDEPGVIG